MVKSGKLPIYQKSHQKKIIFLLIIIFSHIFPIIVSAYYDKSIHNKYDVKLTELRYWLWFFTWWSAWTSLLTVPWALYKLFTLKKKGSGYEEQLGDAIIAETNLLSGIMFNFGGFLLTIHTAIKSPKIIYPLLGEVKTIYIWLLYNFFWHVLAPGLVLYYFRKYCQVDKLVKKKRMGLVTNLFNPTIYLFYVMSRPLMACINYPKAEPHNYPQDYPYSPFFWIVGKFASRSEKENNNWFYFWHTWPVWLKSSFWLLLVVTLWYIIYSLLFSFLIKINNN